MSKLKFAKHRAADVAEEIAETVAQAKANGNYANITSAVGGFMDNDVVKNVGITAGVSAIASVVSSTYHHDGILSTTKGAVKDAVVDAAWSSVIMGAAAGIGTVYKNRMAIGRWSGKTASKVKNEIVAAPTKGFSAAADLLQRNGFVGGQ